jgi:hypothetical protein
MDENERAYLKNIKPNRPQRSPEQLAAFDQWLTDNAKPGLGKNTQWVMREDFIDRGYSVLPRSDSKTGEVAYFPDYETFKRHMAGHLENGDFWTGHRNDDEPDGPLFLCIDANGCEYETTEMPTAYPLFSMTRFDGVWTEQQVKDYANKENK